MILLSSSFVSWVSSLDVSTHGPENERRPGTVRPGTASGRPWPGGKTRPAAWAKGMARAVRHQIPVVLGRFMG
jgi:hypothetical protein